MMIAPIAGQARKNPSPSGPTCKTSEAKTGNKATAPPNNTANISSEKAPSNSGDWRTKRIPSRILLKISSSAVSALFTMCFICTRLIMYNEMK